MRSRIVVVALLMVLIPVWAQAITLFGVGPRGGYSKSADADEGAFTVGAAGRLKLGAIGVEGAIDYRSESFQNDAVKIKSWPVTASVLFYPLPIIYGVAGMGWYNTTIEYDPSLMGLGMESEQTETETGYHIGAGVEIPFISPTITADVRYVFMDYDWGPLPEGEEIDADTIVFTISLFWGF